MVARDIPKVLLVHFPNGLAAKETTTWKSPGKGVALHVTVVAFQGLSSSGISTSLQGHQPYMPFAIKSKHSSKERLLNCPEMVLAAYFNAM